MEWQMPNEKLQVSIVDALTGEQIVRDATKNETDALKIVEQSYVKQQAEKETEAANKKAILDRLGLTADELQTILG
jgi:hypothetical protein